MSLRDDLNKLENALYAYAGSLSLDGSEIEALDRLRAALDSLESAQGAVAPKLSPAAEKWLEALPELLELEKQATPCETPGISFTVHYYNGGSYVSWASEDLKLWHSVRNALHEAAALSTENDKEMK